MISLLITWRNRHDPASGANVSPLRRPLLTWPARPTVKASTRSDGRLTVSEQPGLHRPRGRSRMPPTTDSMSLMSAVDSDVSATSS